jgi:hypothetical protein
MSKYEFLVALMSVIMGGATVMTVVSSWFGYREKKLKYEARPVDVLLDQRLSRIETAVESIATEVERISEGQRFTSKLLSERQGAPAPLASGEPKTQWEGRHHVG